MFKLNDKIRSFVKERKRRRTQTLLTGALCTITAIGIVGSMIEPAISETEAEQLDKPTSQQIRLEDLNGEQDFTVGDKLKIYSVTDNDGVEGMVLKTDIEVADDEKYISLEKGDYKLDWENHGEIPFTVGEDGLAKASETSTAQSKAEETSQTTAASKQNKTAKPKVKAMAGPPMRGAREAELPEKTSQTYDVLAALTDYQFFTNGDLKNNGQHCCGAVAVGGNLTEFQGLQAQFVPSVVAGTADVSSISAVGQWTEQYGAFSKEFLVETGREKPINFSGSFSNFQETSNAWRDSAVDITNNVTDLNEWMPTITIDLDSQSNVKIDCSKLDPNKKYAIDIRSSKLSGNIKGTNEEQVAALQSAISKDLKITFVNAGENASVGVTESEDRFNIRLNGVKGFGGLIDKFNYDGDAAGRQMYTAGTKWIYNYPDATKLNEHRLLGHIVAPEAAVTVGANVEGGIIADSIDNKAEVHFWPYGGRPTPFNYKTPDIKIKKVWLDKDGNPTTDNTTPINVTLYRQLENGTKEKVGDYNINSTDGWEKLVQDLEYAKDYAYNNYYTYTLEEASVSGFDTTIDYGKNADNTPKTGLVFKDDWADGTNDYKTITVTNKANGQPTTPKGKLFIEKKWYKADGETELTEAEIQELSAITIPVEVQRAVGSGDYAKLEDITLEFDSTTKSWITEKEYPLEVDGKSCYYRIKEGTIDGYQLMGYDIWLRDNDPIGNWSYSSTSYYDVSTGCRLQTDMDTKFIIKNKPKSTEVEMPATGGTGRLYYFLAGFGITGLGVVYLIDKRRKRCI